MDTTKCKNCGTDVPGDMRFCPTCGTAVERTPSVDSPEETPSTAAPETEMPEDEATMGWSETPVYAVQNTATADYSNKKFDLKGISFKKFAISAIIAAAVLAVIIVAVVLFSPSKYESIKGSVYIAQSDDIVVIIPDGKLKAEIDGYLMNTAYNLDETKAAALIRDDDTLTSSDGYSLFFIGDKALFISDGVYEFWLAASGDAVAYSRERDITGTGDTAELWLYSGGSNTRITSDYHIHSNCAISPDGKTVAFVLADGERHTMAVWDGKINMLDRDANPVAISDNAKYIYYNRNNSLYVQKGFDGDDREKLGEDVYRLHANRDLSQVVYNTGSRAYISIKGGSRQSLSGIVGSFIFPQGTRMLYGNRVAMYGISKFTDTFYTNADGAIIRINNKYETDNIARGTSYAYLADNGKTLTYLRNDSIYRVNGLAPQPEPKEIVDGDVESFFATSDGKAVYYVNDFSEIFYLKGNNKSTVTSDLSSRYAYALYGKDTLFFVSDKELYTSGGERGRRVSGIDGDVQSVSADAHSVYVVAYDYGDTLTYRSTDGVKFELIHTVLGATPAPRTFAPTPTTVYETPTEPPASPSYTDSGHTTAPTEAPTERNYN